MLLHNRESHWFHSCCFVHHFSDNPITRWKFLRPLRYCMASEKFKRKNKKSELLLIEMKELVTLTVIRSREYEFTFIVYLVSVMKLVCGYHLVSIRRVNLSMNGDLHHVMLRIYYLAPDTRKIRLLCNSMSTVCSWDAKFIRITHIRNHFNDWANFHRLMEENVADVHESRPLLSEKKRRGPT